MKSPTLEQGKDSSPWAVTNWPQALFPVCATGVEEEELRKKAWGKVVLPLVILLHSNGHGPYKMANNDILRCSLALSQLQQCRLEQCSIFSQEETNLCTSLLSLYSVFSLLKKFFNSSPCFYFLTFTPVEFCCFHVRIISLTFPPQHQLDCSAVVNYLLYFIIIKQHLILWQDKASV